MTRDELVALAKDVATANGLAPALVCAVVERESTWDPDAERFEPGFLQEYIVPLKLTCPTEAYARSCSRGLMQVMGQSARERGFLGKLSTLFYPYCGLLWGCKHLTFKIQHAGGNLPLALERWNGGGNPNYAAEVFALMEHYQ